MWYISEQDIVGITIPARIFQSSDQATQYCRSMGGRCQTNVCSFTNTVIQLWCVDIDSTIAIFYFEAIVLCLIAIFYEIISY